MKIDLETGLSIKIEGELGKNKTLSIDKLIEIANSLQDLILTVVKYDLSVEKTIDHNNFKIELSDFRGGSAIPTFVLTQNIQTTIHDYKVQRKQLSEKVNNIFSIMDSGNYLSFPEQYPDYLRRNEIVEKVYNFSKSFGNSPVQFGTYDINNSHFKKAYSPTKFNSTIKDKLIVKAEQDKNKVEEMAFAEIKIVQQGKQKRNQVQQIVNKVNHSISYSPLEIFVRNKQYIFNYPLRCLFEKDDDTYIIKNELLDIIGTGDTQKKAEENFNEEFDYLYTKLKSLEENQLSNRMKKIFSAFNLYLKGNN